MPTSSRAGARTEVTLLSSDIIASATDFTNSGTSALVRYAPCSDSLVIVALKINTLLRLLPSVRHSKMVTGLVSARSAVIKLRKRRPLAGNPVSLRALRAPPLTWFNFVKPHFLNYKIAVYNNLQLG